MRAISKETGLSRKKLSDVIAKLVEGGHISYQVATYGARWSILLPLSGYISYQVVPYDTTLSVQDKNTSSKSLDITKESSSSLTSNSKTVKSSASELAALKVTANAVTNIDSSITSSFSSSESQESQKETATANKRKNSKASKVSNSEKSPTADGSASKKKTPAKAKKTKAKKLPYQPEDLELGKLWHEYALANTKVIQKAWVDEYFAEGIATVKRRTGLNHTQMTVILNFVKNHDFWKNQALSPIGLLKTSKNDLPKVQNIIASYRQANPGLREKEKTEQELAKANSPEEVAARIERHRKWEEERQQAAALIRQAEEEKQRKEREYQRKLKEEEEEFLKQLYAKKAAKTVPKPKSTGKFSSEFK